MGEHLTDNLHGWKAMNRKERIFLIIGALFGAAGSLLFHFAPVIAISGAMIPLAGLTMFFILLSTWRRLLVYERVCSVVMTAAVMAEMLCMRFIFITPTDWAFPLHVICVSVILLMMGALSWKKERIAGTLWGLLGAGYLLYNIAKWIYQFAARTS